MKKFILLIGDIILLYASLALTLGIRYGQLNSELWWEHFVPFTIIFSVWLIVFFINGLYEIRKVTNDFKFYGNLVQNLITNGFLAVIFFYLILGHLGQLKPRTVLLIIIIIFALLFLIWRNIFYKLISSSILSNNLAIIGINPESLLLIQEVATKPQLGYKLKLLINPDYSAVPQKYQLVPISRDIANLKDQLIKYKINTVVTSNNPKYGPEVARYLFESIALKIKYFNLTDFYEKITGKIPITALERHWFLDNISKKNSAWFLVVKRILDILFSIFFGLIYLLLLPLIALLIKLESHGPVIYSQERVGLGGKIFKVYKLRSMVQNAETGGAQWAQHGDSRVTRIGRLIRKTRIDEAPQFFNILKGEMSFVGPRPERPEFVEELKKDIPFYNERHLVKPGLTGWAQINFPYGSSVEDAQQKLSYDLFYIKNQSIALDISIILKTINTVFNASLGR